VLLAHTHDAGRGVGTMFGWGKTFRPKKHYPQSSTGGHLQEHIAATLSKGTTLHAAVLLPPGESEDAWIAANTVDFYNHINLLYGCVAEFCTPATCPVMSAGPRFEYRWADGKVVKKPIEVSAPEYVDRLMNWVEGQLEDELMFPKGSPAAHVGGGGGAAGAALSPSVSMMTEDVEAAASGAAAREAVRAASRDATGSADRAAVVYPARFRSQAAQIYKRLFRVYAHMYHSHMGVILELELENHLNTCFKHFIYFALQFDLIQDRELAPLADLIGSPQFRED